MRSDEASPLTASERLLLDTLLAHSLPGVDPLPVQDHAVDAKSGCTCGCGTIELLPRGDNLPRSDAANPVPVEAQGLNAEGNEIGGLLLFHKDGLIDSLEVYSSIGPPLPLPTLDEVRWTYVDR